MKIISICLVLFLVIGAMLAIALWYKQSIDRGARYRETSRRLSVFRTAISAYALDNRRQLPMFKEGDFVNAISEPEINSYLTRHLDDLRFIDGFGNRFRIIRAVVNEDEVILIRSYGPNGLDDGGVKDDLQSQIFP